MSRYLAFVEIDGLLGVYSVRAVWTALTAVPGILSATVDMTGAVLELDSPVEEAVLAEVLSSAGVGLRAVRQVKTRKAGE